MTNIMNLEVNMKFLLILRDHLEHIFLVIKEGRNMNEISPEFLYGILNIYELKLL